jgi:hypothetical protein
MSKMPFKSILIDASSIATSYSTVPVIVVLKPSPSFGTSFSITFYILIGSKSIPQFSKGTSNS